MAVLLTLSNTLDGVAFTDALSAGGTGVSMGQVSSGSYAPVTDKALNTGRKDLYISHDGVNEISGLAMFLQEYGAGTSFTYGGSDSAANDSTSILGIGSGSGTSKNNGDGLSAGIWFDFTANVSDTNQFDAVTRAAYVKIMGKASLGIDLATAQPVLKEAMVYESTGEQVASSPVDGQIGPAGNTVLGDAAHVRSRFYVPDGSLLSGIHQFEVVFVYAFTS